MNPGNDKSALNSNDVRRRFDRAATSFDSVDFVHSATRDGLLKRLEPMALEPGIVLDLGSATGSASRILARRFRRARIVAADLSRKMLEQARSEQGWFSRTSLVQVNAEQLPFAEQSIDLVFANMLLPWISDPARTFAEIARVLQKGGLFLFATLGPDSLNEIRHAWSDVDDGEHVNRFIDMHDIGDAAVRAGLRDPVLDVDRLAVTYKDSASLFSDLTAMGARNSLQNRNRTLGAAARCRAMATALEAQPGLLSFDLELVYGHCWGAGRPQIDGEYRFDAGQIGRRKR